MKSITPQFLASEIQKRADVQAIYLFGSHAKNQTHSKSDIDLALLYNHHLGNTLEARLRTETLKQTLEYNFNLEGKLDLVDAELVPLPLQFNIIHGQKLFETYPSNIHRFENSILSKWEEANT